MGLKSTENGKKGEAIVAKFFHDRGFWVHTTKRAINGSQPVDIIAIRDHRAILCDAKYVERGNAMRFSLDQIEPDQITSLKYARDFAGLGILGFAIVFERDPESPRWMPLSQYEELMVKGEKSVHREDLIPLGASEAKRR